MKKKELKLLSLNKESISTLNLNLLKGGDNYSLGQVTCECPTESHRPDCVSTWKYPNAECDIWTTTTDD